MNDRMSKNCVYFFYSGKWIKSQTMTRFSRAGTLGQIQNTEKTKKDKAKKVTIHQNISNLIYSAENRAF